MPLTWTIGGVDKSDSVRYQSWSLTECAQRGQVGAATLTIDDTLGTYLPPAQKAITVVESSATPTRLFTGYVAERTTSTFQMPPGQRQWVVTVEDLNVLFDDRIITNAMNGNRPAETDRDRVRWLLGLTEGAACTVLSSPGITSGVLHGAGDDVDMDKTDYRGKTARDVLEDCAQKSGANYFLYDIGSGIKLFYDVGTNATFTSTAYLSDAAADVDSTTVFPISNPEYSYDPSRVYSRLRIRYKAGSTTQALDTTGSNFRVRETYKRWMRAKTETKATAQANKWLAQAATETRSLKCSTIMPAAYVNLIRAGMLIGIKLTRHGFTGYENWRITSRTITQLNDVTYKVDLVLKDKVKPTRFFDGPDVSVDEEFSTATDASTPDSPGALLDANGLTINGGSISVTNGSAEVIIDGTSEFFSIVAKGTIQLPASTGKGLTKKTVSVTTGLDTDPLVLFAARVPSRDGTGDWSQPLPEISISAAGTILRALQGRARYESGAGAAAKTQVQVTRFSSSPPDPAQTIRYWILQKRVI